MKRALLVLTVISILVVGCQPDSGSENAGVQDDGTLNISLSQTTRTSLGAGDDKGLYPTYWSIGDQVVVNGELSDKVSADEHNKSTAEFEFPESDITAPYSVTYPYCSLTSAEKTYVEFPATQEFVNGTISPNSAPMCGYAESGKEISLQHLSAILHIPIKAEYSKSVNLKEVVVTSTSGAKLSGVFKVDCQNATIYSTNSCKSTLTYTFPTNFSLLAAEISDLYISVPAGEIGDCIFEFVEVSGDKMTATWSPSEALPRGVVQEFNVICYERGAQCELELRDATVPAFKKYASADEIKIVSFNVRTTLTESNGITWDSRKEACLQILKDHMPALIGVQEAKYSHHWTYLKEQLADEYSGFGVNRDTGKESGSGETMGILYNRSVLQKLDGGTFWLSETPDVPSKGFGANYYRCATWGIFKHRATGKKICYINTHLDHQSALAQVEGMKIISRFFQTYRKDHLLFLSADFNMSSENEAMDVVEPYMHNAREVAPEGLTDYNTTYNAYTESKYAIIDHIYCSNYLKVVEYHTINEQYNNTVYCSDHYPIYSVIGLE